MSRMLAHVIMKFADALERYKFKPLRCNCTDFSDESILGGRLDRCVVQFNLRLVLGFLLDE